ncbi:MAG: DEAD/DEAH box helicase [Gemmatimonadota bacterium]|nr:DEAD/DEAH box helicase [Gemmatimonadota bacterium]MDE3013835.1 DEAD/DEAH box helicase [Gemmatimonadota bacterium]
MTVPARALFGLDGLELQEDVADEVTAGGVGNHGPPSVVPLSLSPEAASRLRGEIERAGGREVCFLADVDEDRVVRAPRAVARGNFEAVLVAARDANEGSVMLHNHPSGLLEPSDADMRVAALLYDQGIGTAIIDNEATDLYVVVEPPAPKERVLLRSEDLDAVLAPGGALASRYRAYEDRPGQRDMLDAIVERFNEGGISIIEAGTGTGKSLAYLLPAVRWAQENAERTVISTNTINLQEQLAEKDLPLVQELLGDVRWALVKGRGNYVSIRRARLAAESQGTLFDEDRSDEIRGLLEWINTTDDGSLSDLGFRPSSDTWEEVRSDPDICLRARCPHFQACFYQTSRRKAASAELLVVNHHLLFTDLAVRRATGNYTQAAVLPAYKRVVLDEAHNIEDAATSHLGVEITRRGLSRAMSRLDRRGRGILTTIHDAVGGGENGNEIRERVENRVRPALSRGRAAVDGLLERLEPLAPPGEGPVRLGEGGVLEPAADQDISEQLKGVLGTLGQLERELRELRVRLELVEEWMDVLEGRLLDLRSVERRLSATVQGLRLVLAPGEDAGAFVRWLESRGTGRSANLVLAAAPIELGGVLRESLFTQAETTILTSATLTTRRSFGFLRGRLGIDTAVLTESDKELEVDERIVLSPFEFEKQALVVIPTDLPSASGADSGFGEATLDVLGTLADITDGGLFALFTSYSALRRVAQGARDRGLDTSWPLFVQGEDDRHRLLDRFIDSGRGILLGTSSFWEGVDVPGDPLRGLLIQKLPFRVPTEPITAARMEALERRGQDPFSSFMLPHAALRLKQGFGRLIRARTDRGAVLILDDRIVAKRYGRYLRDSLPPAPLIKGPWSDLEYRVRSFYGEG